MDSDSTKSTLRHYLQESRDVVVWKLDGLGEYDIRRPLVRTGTNLLGLIKHLTCVELGYFGPVFGRSMGAENLWFSESAELNSDMWATAEEARAIIVNGYRESWRVADSTIDSLNLSSPGVVPWWSNAPVTLHTVLIHVIAETHRHAGHADVVRELIDGSAGRAAGDSNMPDEAIDWWTAYTRRVEESARAAAGNP